MDKLFELIKKNFKLLVRAKVSSLVIFIGPLLLVSLLGLAYSQSSAFTLTASVYSESYSELSESLMTKMDNQDFRVIRQDSLESCVGSVKMKEAEACIMFPPGMEVKEDSTNEITFYVDYSQINLVWVMLDVMSARVSERSEELSEELTSDLLDRMLFVEEKLHSGEATLDSIRDAGNSIRNASGTMSKGFSRLDISVDFSGIDIDDTKNVTDRISSLLSHMKAAAANMSDEVDSAVDSIEGSASAAQGMINDSDVMEELDDIDDAADEVQDAVDNVTAIIDSDVTNASGDVAAVGAALESISATLSATKSKISDVKKRRDDLLPEFERVESSIDSMISDIESLQGTLDEALQRVSVAKGKSADSIVSPITTRIEPVATQKTHFNSLFPTLLVLIIMITGILLASTLVIVDKKSKAFFRNNFTPTSYFTFNISKYATSLAVILIQLLLFVSVSAFFFETEVLASIWMVLLLVFLVATVFICIGMLVGFLFRTEETVNLAAITLVAVFLLFSSAVIPLESLPSYLQEIAAFNPFVVGELALRQSIIFHLGFSEMVGGLVILVSYAAGIFVLLTVLQNLFRKISFMHFHGPRVGGGLAREKKAKLKFFWRKGKEKSGKKE